MTLLVNDSNVKLQSFRSAVRQYRNNESGAKDMIDTIFHVLDRDVDATSGVVRELAGLFEGDGEGGKQRSVLESLNGFRVEVSATQNCGDARLTLFSNENNSQPLTYHLVWVLNGQVSLLARF